MSGASTSVLTGTGQDLANSAVNRPPSDRPCFEPTSLGNEVGIRESSADNVLINAPKTPRSPLNRVPTRRSLVPARTPLYEKAFESARFVGRNNRGHCPTVIDRFVKPPEASPPRGGSARRLSLTQSRNFEQPLISPVPAPPSNSNLQHTGSHKSASFRAHKFSAQVLPLKTATHSLYDSIDSNPAAESLGGLESNTARNTPRARSFTTPVGEKVYNAIQATSDKNMDPLERQKLSRRALQEYLRLNREVQQKNWLETHKKIHGFEYTPAQKRTLRKWFDILDYDGSGEISLEELEDPLISTGIVNSREECQSFIRTVDQDGSGEIGFKEFLKLLNPKLDSSATSSRKKGHVSKDSAAGVHKEVPHIYKAVNSKAVRKLQGIVCKTDRDMSSVVHQQRRKLILDAITSLYTYPTKGEKKDSQDTIVNSSLICSAPTTSREKMESNVVKRQQLEVMTRVIARLKSLPKT